MYIKRPLCILTVAFSLLIFVYVQLFPLKPSFDMNSFDRKTVAISGVVKQKDIKNGEIRLYIKNALICLPAGDQLSKSKGFICQISNEKYKFSDVEIESKIYASGKYVALEEPCNEGMFDSKTYYLCRGYEGFIKDADIEAKSNGYSYYREKLAGMRYYLETVIDRYFDEENGGVLKALILGDKTYLDSDIKDLYQNSGISHILSLSGLHIAAVGLFIIKKLKRTSIPHWCCAFIATFLMISYGIMTGMSISTKRALVMFFIGILAETIGKSYDFLISASVASFIVLLGNPYFICDSGFLLSFGAIIGISLVYPALQTLIRPSKRNVFGSEDIEGPKKYVITKLKYIGDALLISLSINIATFPIQASSFYKISLYSFLANLIVIPLMSIVLIAGFIFLIFGSVGFLLESVRFNLGLSGVRIVCSILSKITTAIFTIYDKIAVFCTSLQSNTIVIGKPGGWKCFWYYTIITIVVAGMAGLEKRKLKKSKIDQSSRRNIKNSACDRKEDIDKITLSLKMKNTVFKGLSWALLIFSVLILPVRGRERLEIRNVSVGQGDCGVIMGENTPVIIVDGGSSDIKNAGKYRLLPVLLSNGISQVEYVFLSHLDQDHISAVMEIIENRSYGVKVKRVILPECLKNTTVKEEKDKLIKLESALGEGGVKLFYIKAGDIIEAGDVRITCLWPLGNYSGLHSDAGGDSNENSMVLGIELKGTDFKALFTGDIGSESEKQMLDLGLLDKYTYLKVAHHGSKNSSSSEFLNKISPDISVISAGKGNSYGHPHKETLERLDKYAKGTRVLRTDESGQVTIIVNRNLTIKQFKRKGRDDK